MQNCPLKVTRIVSAVTLNTLKPTGPPAATALILHYNAFVTKFRLYPKTGYCLKCFDKSLIIMVVP